MPDDCYRIEEMDDLLHLSPADPRLRHLSACPLCRARLAAYRMFVAGGAPAAGSRPEEAAEALEAFTARLVSRESAHGSDHLWSRLRSRRVPRLVPGLVTAAAAIVILLVIFRPFGGVVEREPAALRGLEPRPGVGLEVSSPQAEIGNGVVRFGWEPFAGADRYEISVLDTRLDEVGRFEAAGDTRASVDIGRLPADAIIWWRVVAYRGGDELARSRLVSLDLSER